jgi:hypothetical protein
MEENRHLGAQLVERSKTPRHREDLLRRIETAAIRAIKRTENAACVNVQGNAVELFLSNMVFCTIYVHYSQA